MTPAPLIELVEVSKAFNEGRGNEYWAIQGVSLAFASSGVSVLRGPSGSGKTTLLSLIGCLARPTSGRVRFRGEDISALPERHLTDLRRRHFGFVFQQFNLIAGMSSLENVLLPGYPVGGSYEQLVDRAAGLLERFRLAHRGRTRVELLSGGEQQRVAIARALVNCPEVLIADEPTANLDTRLAAEFIETAAQLKSDGVTVLIATHDPLLLDSRLADRVVDMRDGQMSAVN